MPCRAYDAYLAMRAAMLQMLTITPCAICDASHDTRAILACATLMPRRATRGSIGVIITRYATSYADTPLLLLHMLRFYAIFAMRSALYTTLISFAMRCRYAATPPEPCQLMLPAPASDIAYAMMPPLR